MANGKWHILLVFAFALIALSVLLILSSGSQGAQTGKIRVVATIMPQKEFIERIGGDKVEVTIMVPPGASPHTYEPTPRQLVEVSNAKAYFKVGSGIDFEISWMESLAKTNSQMQIFDSSKGVMLIDAAIQDDHEDNAHQLDEGMKDPHIWNSPKNALLMAKNIYGGLSKIDPENEAYYRKNMENYALELSELEKKIMESIANMGTKKFLVYHPAWGYFAQEFGLEQIAVEEEGKEITIRGIENIIRQAKQYNISIVFASPEFSTKNAEIVANEIGGKVILISPLEEKYIENMGKIAEEISNSAN